MKLKEILINEYRKRPAMQAADFIKLIYQNEFGGAHIGFCTVQSKNSITEEWNAPLREDDELFEPVGNGLGRANIAKVRDLGISLDTFCRIVYLSGRGKAGKEADFDKKLDILRECAESREIPVYIDEIDRIYEYMEENDFEPIGHSMEYKARYNPHYRLVQEEIARYFGLFAEIDKRIAEKGSLIISIDGRSGSGKSNLGEMLAFVYECDVVHMDDFFLPEEMKTPERLAEPGGNVYYERFEKEAFAFLGNSFSYKPYSCKTKDFGEAVTIRKAPLSVVEGVYCQHPRFEDKYDLKVFLDVTPELQKERILKRSGEELWEKFEKIWIPLEEEYFSKLGVKDKADFYFLTEK